MLQRYLPLCPVRTRPVGSSGLRPRTVPHAGPNWPAAPRGSCIAAAQLAGLVCLVTRAPAPSPVKHVLLNVGSMKQQSESSHPARACRKACATLLAPKRVSALGQVEASRLLWSPAPNSAARLSESAWRAARLVHCRGSVGQLGALDDPTSCVEPGKAATKARSSGQVLDVGRVKQHSDSSHPSATPARRYQRQSG